MRDTPPGAPKGPARSSLIKVTCRLGPQAHDEQMNPHSMVFGVGDQVTGWGRMVADEDGQWLDLAGVTFLPLFDPPRPVPRSHRSIRLIGADFDAVPTQFGPHHATPDHATITGM